MSKISASSKLRLEAPKEGLAALTAHFKSDFVAGATISLIALPLCLGIAAAANLPPIAGLFTAIVGGMLASRIAGAHMVVSGPAAGLIVANLAAVETLGGSAPDPTCDASTACAHYAAGYPHALGAMMVASMIIMLFGVFKAGKLGDFFPSAVIHGMLAAIGLIIMVKQLFVALGTKTLIAKEIAEWKHNGGFEYGLVGDFVHIPDAFAHLYEPAAIIGAVAIAIVFIHPFIPVKVIKAIPSALWVLVATIPLGKALDLATPKSFSFGDTEFQQVFLVKLPPNIMAGVAHPSFDKITQSAFWIAVITIALITSIESMLSEVAVDTLDPYRRRTNLNKGLFSNGAGSFVASFIGGIPMVSEIVRSSANISSGAKTQWANFWHGAFLLIFLLIGKPVIDMIPSAALAGILITVGFKLASPRQFMHVMEIGREQLFLFTLTMVAVLCSDLLIGVAIGIVAQLAIHFYHGTPILNAFKPDIAAVPTANGAHIKISGSVIFSNYLGIKNHILKTVKETKAKDITLDFKEAMLVDHSVMTALRSLENLLEENGRTLKMINMDHMVPATGHPLATREGSREQNRMAGRV